MSKEKKDLGTKKAVTTRKDMPKISKDRFEIVMDNETEEPYLVEFNDDGEVIAERNLSNEFMSYMLITYGDAVTEVSVESEEGVYEIIVAIAPKEKLRNVIQSLEDTLEETE